MSIDPEVVFLFVWCLLWAVVGTALAARYNRWVTHWRVAASAVLVAGAYIAVVGIGGAEIWIRFGAHAASGIEAATAVGTTEIGPTEGESPVPKADAQRPPQ